MAMRLNEGDRTVRIARSLIVLYRAVKFDTILYVLIRESIRARDISVHPFIEMYGSDLHSRSFIRNLE
jgi:hypothetical protein